MQGSILINRYYYDDGMKYMTHRLADEFSRLGVSVNICPTPIYTIPSGFDMLRQDNQFIVYLNKDLKALKALEEAGLRVFNSYFTTSLCDDKQKTLDAVKDCGVAFMDTVVSPLVYAGFSAESDKEFCSQVENLGYPLIIKEASGSQGKQVYLIESREELLIKIQQLQSTPFIVQKYFPVSQGCDIRYYIAGGEAVTAVKRQNTFSYKSNVFQGAKTLCAEMDERHRQAANTIAQKLKMDFGSVDFFDCAEPILIEANANAYFKGAESFGFNVAEKICIHILEVINDRAKH